MVARWTACLFLAALALLAPSCLAAALDPDRLLYPSPPTSPPAPPGPLPAPGEETEPAPKGPATHTPTPSSTSEPVAANGDQAHVSDETTAPDGESPLAASPAPPTIDAPQPSSLDHDGPPALGLIAAGLVLVALAAVGARHHARGPRPR